MLVVNKIGPARVKSVRLASDTVVVRLVDGTELLYRRVEGEGSEKIQVRCGPQTSRL